MAFGFFGVDLSVGLSVVTALLLIWPLFALTQNCSISDSTASAAHRPLPFRSAQSFWMITQPYLAPHPFSSAFLPLEDPSLFSTSPITAQAPASSSRAIPCTNIMAPVLFIVTPGSTQFAIADGPTAYEVQTRRKDFVKNENMYKPLNMFGPNVVISNGGDVSKFTGLEGEFVTGGCYVETLGWNVRGGREQHEKDFPQLERCLAFMYEALRLYGPVCYMPRYTTKSNQRLVIQGKEIVIPPDVHLLVNNTTLHTLPLYWGNDYSVWRPDRWLGRVAPTATRNIQSVGAWPASLFRQEFAQVEFVTVIARLLKNGAVKPKLKVSDMKEDAIVRVREVVQDNELDVTLHMKHPEKASLVWEIWA